EARLKSLDRSSGQHKLSTTQDIVDVDSLDRQHIDIRYVARRANKRRLNLGTVDEQGVVQSELMELAAQCFGLAVGRSRLVENDELAGLRLDGERVTER